MPRAAAGDTGEACPDGPRGCGEVSTSPPAGPGMSSPAPAAEPLGRSLLDELGVTLGEHATLIQFSTAFCAPCRATRTVLARAAGMVAGVNHVVVDAEAHLGAVRTLGIEKTPTTLVLDRAGHEVLRATGVPVIPAVIAALAAAGTPGTEDGQVPTTAVETAGHAHPIGQ